MPRTSRQTLEYWQFDVGLFKDGKIVDLNDRYGPLGEAIYFRILSYIAETDGYFAQLNESLLLWVYRSIGSKWIRSRQVVAEVIDYCGVCGLFDVNLLRQNVLTSRGIQRRWLYAKQKSRARGYSTAEYWLLENEPLHGVPLPFSGNVRNNPDNCSNNPDNCDKNSPYKVKESKVKESKEKIRTAHTCASRTDGQESEDVDSASLPSSSPYMKEFFDKYRFADYPSGDLSKYDFKLLLDRFAESNFLQKTYSWRWVEKNYESILRGEKKDFPKRTRTEAEEAPRKKESGFEKAQRFLKKYEEEEGTCEN